MECGEFAQTVGSSETRSDNETGSDSSSTEEEDRLRRLFQLCDRDGDGYIDSEDLHHMCTELRLDVQGPELMQQLGVDGNGSISFAQFIQCRLLLCDEIEEEKRRTRALSSSPHRGQHRLMVPLPCLMTPDSDNSTGFGVGPSSPDYDSGARDMSPEPHSLYKLLDLHDPSLLAHTLDSKNSPAMAHLVELANQLHLAALTSLKGEVHDLNKKLQDVIVEKELLSKQLSWQQSERLRVQRECDDRVEEQTIRYEQELIELHSVIAELSKKIDRQQFNVIREEEESESRASSRSGEEEEREDDDRQCEDGERLEDSDHSNVSECSDTSHIQDIVPCSDTPHSAPHSDPPDQRSDQQPLTSETSPEAVIHTEDTSPLDDTHRVDISDTPSKSRCVVQRNATRGHQQLVTTCHSNNGSNHSLTAAEPVDTLKLTEMDRLHTYLSGNELQKENEQLRDQIGRQERELNRLRAQLGGLQQEKETQHKRMLQLQTQLQNLESAGSTRSIPSTPTKSVHGFADRRGSGDVSEQIPVGKIAELKKLKTGSPARRQVLGAEMTKIASTKIAEHLAQRLQEGATDVSPLAADETDMRLHECAIELERLRSRAEHALAKAALLDGCLTESRAHAHRLTVLTAQYESNVTAAQIANRFADTALDASAALVVLLDSELALCRVSRHGDCKQNSVDVEHKQRARRHAEQTVRNLLHRMAGHKYDGGPWEELSSPSRTASSTSSTASGTESDCMKGEEQRLREWIAQLLEERSAVQQTVMELESVHVDPSPKVDANAQRIDLENAVLMQELMAVKEEKAELKAANYLLTKEKKELQAQLKNSNVQEQQTCIVETDQLNGNSEEQHGDSQLRTLALSDVNASNPALLSQQLSEANRREKSLKARIQQLIETLEKLSHNSDVRHQQSAEFVNDLKRANAALISAFEKAKTKYQNKVKRLETEIQVITERHQTQIYLMQQKIARAEQEVTRSSNGETPL